MDVFQGKLSQRRTLYEPVTSAELINVKEIDVVVCVTLKTLLNAHGVQELDDIVKSLIVPIETHTLKNITHWTAGYTSGQEGQVDGYILIRVNATVEKFQDAIARS